MTSIVVTNQAIIDAWMERDVDACSIIFYNIEPTYQTSIEGSTTAHEMWTRLTLQYAKVSVANAMLMHLYYLVNFINIKWTLVFKIIKTTTDRLTNFHLTIHQITQ